MFKIKSVKFNENNIVIKDRNNKDFYVSIYDSRVRDLLPLASNRSKQINKNIKLIDKYFIIAVLTCIFASAFAFTPLILGKTYAEIFLVSYGLLDFVSVAFMISCKVGKTILKKYSISNEYWEQIYKEISNNKINNNNFNNIQSRYNNINNNNRNNMQNINSNSNITTYSYSGKSIIQDYSVKDKIKVYKKF